MFEQFKFKNFEPSEEVRNFANRTLHQILDLLPGESHFGASLAKVGNAFEGLIEVISTAGVFKEKTSHEDPRTLLDVLSSKIKEKIATWHQKRILDFKR